MKKPTGESALHRFFLCLWYQAKPSLLARCLYPLSRLFFFIAAMRRSRLSRQATPFTVPIVVVGNISVGGTGKTPVIIGLANTLKQNGINVGVVSRGYGSQAMYYPFEVTAHSKVCESGDEALLIAKSTQSPVFIGRDRAAVVECLLKHYPATQLILSDDGLQHYRLYRDLEIIVIDGKKGIGNGYGLPAGPLREPKERLAQANMILVNGPATPELTCHFSGLPFEHIQLKPKTWSLVNNDIDKQCLPANGLPWQGPVIAVAAIGNPQRFFDTLASLEVDFTPIAFDDHHQFSADDFVKFSGQTIVMTAKDAVKCSDFAQTNWWQLEVECALPHTTIELLKNTLTS